jgi:hypothetical protein
MPRSAIIITKSLRLNLKLVYQLTHRMMICPSKCRPYNSASTGTNGCILSSSPIAACLHQNRFLNGAETSTILVVLMLHPSAQRRYRVAASFPWPRLCRRLGPFPWREAPGYLPWRLLVPLLRSGNGTLIANDFCSGGETMTGVQ